MTAIYSQHRATFANVSAYVIARDGQRVATVSLKFGGQVTAYVHWIGVEMRRGFARGGGYDRSTAAVMAACRKIEWPIDLRGTGPEAFALAIDGSDGDSWDRALTDAGFTVWQAV